MRLPRPSRVFAIARRDVAQTIQGRRGLTLTAVTALLLLPASSVPINLPTEPPEPARTEVHGDVPEEVLVLPTIVASSPGEAKMQFTRDSSGQLVVQAGSIPASVRDALDGDTPALTVERSIPNFPLPGRTALLALISASVLTGGISESIGGERSRKTLQVMLAAAVTRTELVIGKWLAWTGYAAVAAYLAAAVSIITGRASFGWWLLPLPMVAAGTVALGLFLVRHTSDVVSGAAVSLRVLPALLTVTGLVSLYFADISPIASAALPVGGALLASGSTWPGWVTPVVATLSTTAFCAVLLARTAADLERPAPPPATWVRRAREALIVTALAALCWWLPVVAPLLWGAAGNPGLTERLPTLPGVVAGGLGLLAMVVLYMGRTRDPQQDVGLTGAPAGSWVAAVGVGGLLAGLWSVPVWAPTAPTELLIAADGRLDAALMPRHLVVALVALVGQELVFRGWLHRSAGPVAASFAFCLVLAPFDPIRGMAMATSLAVLTALSRNSVGPAILARVVAVTALFFLTG